jgi:serine/threonine-protein kinase
MPQAEPAGSVHSENRGLMIRRGDRPLSLAVAAQEMTMASAFPFPALGQTLGSYRLLAGIALGGEAAVFRGLDERSQRLVAVKIPLLGALADDQARQRLRCEALALRRLSHPGVTALLDLGSQDGIDFLVTEYAEGSTLAARLREAGPLDEAAARSLGLRIGAVLAEVHRRGVVHCDLKPSNIVLSPGSQVKLLDFGQAQLSRHDAGAPLGECSRSPAGTLPYMAPERLQRQPSDPRADLWSLGVLLYEQAAGRRPFRGDSSDLIAHAILREPPQPPSSQSPRLSAGFDRILLKALEKDRDRRYPSVDEMLADLAAT